MKKSFSLLSARAGAVFLTPAAALVGAFVLLPFFWVIFVSFTNRTLLGKTALNPEFVGLQNYLSLFDPATFFTARPVRLLADPHDAVRDPLGAGRAGAARACCSPG